MHTLLKIEGTHCESCKALIEEVAHDIPGIENCTVDFHTGETQVTHGDSVDWERFEQELSKIGSYSIASRTSSL